MSKSKSKDGLRLTVIAFVTLAIATSGLFSSIQTAAAASDVKLWAVPVTSCIDDGKLQILRLKFNLENVNPLEKIRITLDPGTPDEQILEFDGNGAILVSDPAFDGIDGSIKFKTDGYYFLLAHLKGKFKIGVFKDELAVGDHTALAEIFTEGASSTPSDDATFKLKECEDGKPDLVAKHLATPHWIQMDREYHAYFTEKNQGGSKAGEHVIKLFLSYDDELDSGDELLGQTTVEQLFATRSKTFHIPFELPDDAVKGPAFLIGMTDADEEVDEEDEGNNDRIREIMIGRPQP